MSLKLWPEQLPSQWRLALILAAQVGIGLLVIFLFVRMAATQDMRTINRNRLLDSLMEHAAVHSHSGLEGLKKMVLAGQPMSRYGLRVTQADGSLVYEDIPAQLKSYKWPEQPQKTLLVKGDSDLLEMNDDSQPYVFYVGAIRLGNGGLLWLGRTDAQTKKHIANLERHLWFAGFTAALLAFLPLMWYLKEVLRPIHSYLFSAERMRVPGSTTRLRSTAAIPELKSLATVVNAGLDQIQALTRELQTTNDFLAHELRTPLARIRGNLEHFHDETDNRDAQEAAARSLEEIDRATQLVHTLLTIRAGDHSALRLYRQATSLDELLTSLVELFIPAAEDRRLGLRLEGGLSMALNIDRELLTQAVSNLLDNALAYTPAGGQITVRWQGEGTGALILVQDTGPGLHPDEVEAIWARYVRGSAARPKSSGMGLGLSLVRSIAMAHGGYAGAQNNREGPGASFWIYIPGL